MNIYIRTFASPGCHEHVNNLKLLAATLQSRLTVRKIRLNQLGQALFGRFLGMAIRIIAMTVLKV